MSTIVNPYEAPASAHAPNKKRAGTLHEWEGHIIAVSAHASALVLWTETVVSVSVDDAETFRQRTIRLHDNFHFQFKHRGRLVSAFVVRRRGIFARNVKYQLIVDDGVVANSHALIDNGELGIAIMMFVNAIVFGAIAYFFFR